MSAKIWYQLVDAATGGPFAHTRASAVRRIRVFDIQDFCADVYAKDLKRFQSLIESQLRVFKSRDAFDKQHKPLEPSDSVAGLGGDIEHALIVVVPSLYRGSEIIFPLEALKMVGTQCEARIRVPLLVDDRVHELPVSCTRGSGLELRDSEKPLTLFCRPQFLKQWGEMYRNSVRTYALLWILGPPGAGKSCTALAFAYALEPTRWDVIWLQLSYKDRVVNFVWLRGNEKIMCTLEMSTLDSQLLWLLSNTSTEETTILFLDGYDYTMKEEREARFVCKEWQERDAIKHRLVFVCSTLRTGGNFRPDHACEIPAVAAGCGWGLHGVEMAFPSSSHTGEAQVDGATSGQSAKLQNVDNINSFKLLSWSFEDYVDAIRHQTFFKTVKGVFHPYPESEGASEEENERMELLKMKYCVAGGSARLMFDVSTDKAVESLDERIRHVRDVGVVDRLRAVYYKAQGCLDFPYTPLISAYVARKLALTHDFQLLKLIASRCVVDMMDEWLMEAWFLSVLSTHRIEFVEEGPDQVRGQWGRSHVRFFDPVKPSIELRLDHPTWATPVQWSEAGFDAVFVDKANALVRFVQVTLATLADHHSFDHRNFVELLEKLATHDDLKDVQLKKVELYYVVPMCRLSVFERPLETADFKEDIVQDRPSPVKAQARGSRTRGDFVLESCEVEVKTLGVDYKISPYYYNTCTTDTKRTRRKAT